MPYRRLMLDNGAECQVWEIVLDVTLSARSARASARVLCFLTGGEWRWLQAPPPTGPASRTYSCRRSGSVRKRRMLAEDHIRGCFEPVR